MQLSGRVPLKLGHEGPDARNDPTTQFAMGWVNKVWRDGGKLLADMDVPEKVFSLIRQGFLKFCSIELLKNVKASTRNIPWVLDAVALLGSDQPAVGVLKDLQALTMSRRFTSDGVVTFTRADVTRNSNNLKGDRTKMTDSNTGDLADKVLELSRQMADIQAENRSLRERDAEFKQLKARNERLTVEIQQDKISRHRDTIKAAIDSAVRSEQILPAARERFTKVYRIDNDEAVMTIELADVEEFIKENPNGQKKPERKRVFNSLRNPDDDIPEGTAPDDAVLMRANAILAAKGKDSPTADDIQRAAVAAFKRDPELAANYVKMATEQYGHNRVASRS